jgi:thiamine pyrophosphokinase
MSKFTILLGGDLVRTPVLVDQVAGTRIIAADSGIRHAELLGLTPELWVGDFDSVPDDLPHHLRSVPTQKFPAEKDKTDGELAIDIAREKGATELILAGAFGGLRADHAFLHLALAVRLAHVGISVMLTSGSQEGVPLLARSTQFDYAEGTMFSILGFSDLDGLTVEGASWPLRNIKVPFGSSLTISNVVAGKLRIELASGRALLIAHPFPISGS